MPSDCPRQSDRRQCRLQKYLAFCGLGSRRSCESMIAAGRVKVDGRIVTEQGVGIDPAAATVSVDGRVVNPGLRTYILLNKPRGVITTCRDPGDRPTFKELLPGIDTRVHPVGRLDKDSEGLLILTNDGSLTHALTHPRHGVAKTYLVNADGKLTAEQSALMLAGVESDGETLRMERIRAVPGEGAGAWYEVVLKEGRKRQIRRMFASQGLRVLALRRASIGPLELGSLPVGSWRYLTEEEVSALRRSAESAGGRK